MMSFETLQKLVRHCTASDAPPFYRRLYGLAPDGAPLDIASLQEWAALPYFVKEDLIRTPLTERTFPPLARADAILTSSGTSGKGVLFNLQRYTDGYRYRLRYHDFPRATLSSMPTAPLQTHLHAQYAPTSKLIVLDPHPERVRASVKLAKAAGVESACILTPHVMVAAAAMREEDVTDDIRFIEIAGEKCTHALYSFLKKTFPNATITSVYGSNDFETSPIGVSCRPIDGRDPLEVYHALDSYYLEIIDPETGALLSHEPGVEGDLLVTSFAGDGAMFPLIRYRIGDTVRVIDAYCAEHGEMSFEVLGRTEMDFVKLLGGMLRADEIERTLRMFPEKVTDVFELHCYTEETPNGPLFRPVLHVEPVGPLDLESFAAEVSRSLRVAPSFTYATGVVERRYLPLQCEELKKSAEIAKRKRIVQH